HALLARPPAARPLAPLRLGRRPADDLVPGERGGAARAGVPGARAALLVRRLVTFHLELASRDAAPPAAPRPGFSFAFERRLPVRAASARSHRCRRSGATTKFGPRSGRKCGLELPLFQVKRLERPH